MSPEERALQVCQEMERKMRLMGVVTTAHYDSGLPLIAAAIRDAVAQEREACAQVAEEDRFTRWLRDNHIDNADIAAAIRVRT